jgi:hypothetical protein
MGRPLGIILSLLIAASAAGQTIVTITESALGHPVPEPVDSTTPLNGFRSYDSLQGRFLSLTLASDFIEAVPVGTSLKGRTITAYRFGTANARSTGPAKGAAFLSGTMHAREWASPEVVAGIFEWLAEDDGDPIREYVRDSLEIVILPIANPDGFVVTQQTPRQTVGGSASGSSGRDGRMRRKNLRDTDGILTTLGDYLNGVDLNRNLPVGFGNAGSSGSPTSINYRGPSAASEPETQALIAAAGLLPPDRIRLAIDFHSFGQLYYVITDDSPSRNAAVQACYQFMRSGALAQTGRDYSSIVTDVATGSVGAVDEYFTGTFFAMGYTCEIRPITSTNGFILPNGEIAAARAELLAATRNGLLYAAGPPAVLEVRVLDGETTIYTQRRLYESSPVPARRIETNQTTGLLRGRVYTVELVLDQPVRVFRDGGWRLLPGISDQGALVSIEHPGLEIGALDFSESTRWSGDTIRATITVKPEADEGEASLSLSLANLLGVPLDRDPRTLVEWSPTGWLGWETDGVDELAVVRIGEEPASVTGWQVR